MVQVFCVCSERGEIAWGLCTVCMCLSCMWELCTGGNVGGKCWNRQSCAQPHHHWTDQIADACMRRTSISFLAYFLHHRYIVRAHHPPAYLIFYLLLCPDLPRSFYPFYLVFNTLVYKFPFSLSSTSVRCTHTTTEVSYIFTSLPTRANPYIVPFSIGKSNIVRCTCTTTEFLSR